MYSVGNPLLHIYFYICIGIYEELDFENVINVYKFYS